MVEITNNSGIYQITHKDRVVYVGSAINLQRRCRQHFEMARAGKHHNFIFQRFYFKHHEELLFSVIEECQLPLLAEREQYWIDRLKPLSNLAKANGSHPHTEEARAKMRGRQVSEETRIKISEALKGKISKNKGIPTGRVPKSAFQAGIIPWNKGLKNVMVSWNKGKHLSADHKIKLSEAKKKEDNLIGQKFGRWFVLDYSESKGGARYWLCECKCGTLKPVNSSSLKLGSSTKCKSCSGKLSNKKSVCLI